jgi:hypothetical protein
MPVSNAHHPLNFSPCPAAREPKGRQQIPRVEATSNHNQRLPNTVRARCCMFPQISAARLQFLVPRVPVHFRSISKYACCSGECFVLALVYIDRIIQSNPTFVVNSLNIHRLLITRFGSLLAPLRA